MIKQVKSMAVTAEGPFVETLARASGAFAWAALACACLLGLRADRADDLRWPVMTAQHAAAESSPGLAAPTRQWHLERLAAHKAWAASTGEGVVIAVIDSGVDPEHPDLKDHLLPGWNLVDNSADTRDTRGHGTAVAGAAAAGFNRAQGLSGVAAGARILPLKVTDEMGYTSVNAVVKAIYLAANRGARIVNVSFEFVGGHPAVLQAARYLHERGGMLVVPSGNKGVHQAYPVAPGLMTVAATDEQDAHPAWSTRGPHVTVSAPGQGLLLPKLGGRYGEFNGTSYASPLVAGVLALMVAAYPQASSEELRQALESSALDLGEPGRDPRFGAGRIDADGALRAITAAASLKAARH
jgi:subtilisin family serine protease